MPVTTVLTTVYLVCLVSRQLFFSQLVVGEGTHVFTSQVPLYHPSSIVKARKDTQIIHPNQ